jgi:hypothetical protein
MTDLGDSLRKELAKAKIAVWQRRPEILLSANTVKPMHEVVPRLILGQAWWDLTRQEAYRSTNFHCIACGVHKYDAEEHQWLEGHELYSVDYVMGRQTYLETVPLCHYCHCFIHDGRLEALFKKGEVSKEKYLAVCKHGRDVLKAAGLKPLPPYRGPIARWEDWRLVLFDKEYPPVHKTYEEWKKVFNPTEEH